MEDSNTNSLFGVINYKKIEDLNRFIDEMSPDHALYVLVQATKFAHKKGIYEIEEGEVVSKAIRVLTTPPPIKDDENRPPDVDVHKA